jgi:excisionase family DNA binding protein
VTSSLPNNGGDKHVSISQASRILGCHPETLRRWERAGKIRAGRTPGRQRRYNVADLRALLGGNA